MSSRSRRLQFDVFPLWQFLQDTFGFEQSFAVFGPYRGASIEPHVLDEHTIEVRMPLVLSNTNYVGAHFGGSLYSMCDPWFMALLIKHLGPDYMVWDKGAKIDFVQPGQGTVKAVFHIPAVELDEIREQLQKSKKLIRHYTVTVQGESGETVATVDKELYIRRLVTT
ncbi:MAG: YiiD C-terminal domain-containing protein [Leptospiraceae bacterium]|nr:YiiD C-terminal domain-containing protein [Leptospiraceae bacterium]